MLPASPGGAGFGSGPSSVMAGGQWGRSAESLQGMSEFGDPYYHQGVVSRGLDMLGGAFLGAGLPQWVGTGVEAMGRHDAGQSWPQAIAGAAVGAFVPEGGRATDYLWDRYGGDGGEEEDLMGPPLPPGYETTPSPPRPPSRPFDPAPHWAPSPLADQAGFYGVGSGPGSAADALYGYNFDRFYGTNFSGSGGGAVEDAWYTAEDPFYGTWRF